jgi:hypothetical protein
MRAVKIAALAILVLLGLLFPASSQDDKKLNEDPNSRTLEGVVTDAGGNPANGAIVQLKDLKTLAIRSFVTHEDGKYHFAGLSTNGDYEVRATTSGGQSSGTKRLSVYDTKKTATINLKLKSTS